MKIPQTLNKNFYFLIKTQDDGDDYLGKFLGFDPREPADPDGAIMFYAREGREICKVFASPHGDGVVEKVSILDTDKKELFPENYRYFPKKELL